MEGKGWKYYHTMWLMLFLAWLVSYTDRALMTPIITWMINNKIAFFASAPNAYTLGGLIGGLFFAGYMLMQFPAGYLGDKYGHKTVAVISIMWAAVATLLTGFAGSLFMFVALRVLTGLGEGAFYSNDRTLIAASTPPQLRGLGMGLVISGLTCGLTIALISGSYTINWAAGIFGMEDAWRWPFFIWTIPTIIVGILMLIYIKNTPPVKYENVPEIKQDYPRALTSLSGYAGVFLIIVMAIYYFSITGGLPNVAIAFIETAIALLLVAVIYARKGEEIKVAVKDKNLVLIYISAIAILWSLWFYGFWSVAIIKEVGKTSFMVAALTAAFNAIAGIIGFPLGGKLSDIYASKGKGRKGVLITLTALHAVFILLLAVYVMNGGKSAVTMGVLLFMSGLFFFALQPVSHAMTADLAPPGQRATAFGMWNLIGEIGAVLSPVVSGALRDSYGGWAPAIFLDGFIVAFSIIFIVFVREKIQVAGGIDLGKGASIQ